MKEKEKQELWKEPGWRRDYSHSSSANDPKGIRWVNWRKGAQALQRFDSSGGLIELTISPL